MIYFVFVQYSTFSNQIFLLKGASFSAVAPASPPLSLFSRATPGPAPGPVISVTIKCMLPRALGVLFTLILEWEDALLSSGRLALRSGLHLSGFF